MIPTNLRYQSKTESAPGRRFLTQIQPQGSTTFGQGETITINLPTRANTCLIPSESYLKGTLNLVVGTATTATTLESCGFHGMIQRVRLFHGSNLLEDIDQYHQLAKILFDYQVSEDAVKGRFSITAGTNPDYSVLQAAAAGDVLNAASVNRGRALGALSPAGTFSFPFALNLISMVGSLAGEKYLPLFEMSAAPLRLEIVLQSSAERGLMRLGGAITSFNMSGVNYCGEFLELPDSAISAIKAGSSSPMQMVIPSWRAYTNSANVPNTTQTQVSFPIPAKFSSLKNIVVATRNNASVGVNAQYPLSHCAFGVGTSNSIGYQFRVGAEVLPSTAPVTHSETYSEALKCFGSLADLTNQPSVTRTAYELDAPVAVTNINTASTTESGAHLVGIDLEIYQGADKSSIFSGTNTNNSDIFAIINYYQSSGAAITILQTAFACYDQVLVYENGVCYARY
jgi:hypothetical protein